MSLWILGTDTSVGKTVVSALTLLRYHDVGRLGYWKPVSTGGADDRDRATLEGWIGALAPELDILPETYHLDEPVSPHLAARLAGVVIDPERVLHDLVEHGLAVGSRNLVIEGAGGLMVPLNDAGALLVDLVVATALPVVLVARSTLGTINHTLLSLEALRSRHVEIAGVVINGPPNEENSRVIERWGRVRIIGEVAALADGWAGFQLSASELSRSTLEVAVRSFDREGILGEYL